MTSNTTTGPGTARDVVLLCNPRAGGRWKVLAEILDSEEARAVRRIVTDEIDDVREAIAGLSQRVRLICIYGGDGTVFRVIAELLRRPTDQPPQLAILGGGTMNVTARWCGMAGSPASNFRQVIRAYRADHVLWRDVPLVAVRHGEQTSYGFTFGAGPLVRILQRYEENTKGHLAALSIAGKSIAAAVGGMPRELQSVVREMYGRVVVDGAELPYNRYVAVFANVTGAINPFIEPFVAERTRESFHFLAYAASSREFALLAPLLARGRLPIDPRSLLKPISTWRRILLSMVGQGDLPLDPRYVNHPARQLLVQTNEEYFTIDGELLPVQGQTLDVRLGPPVRLVMLRAQRPRKRRVSDLDEVTDESEAEPPDEAPAVQIPAYN